MTHVGNQSLRCFNGLMILPESCVGCCTDGCQVFFF
jgi:hypothetical protein